VLRPGQKPSWQRALQRNPEFRQRSRSRLRLVYGVLLHRSGIAYPEG
jgi:hypothetical protein